MGLEIDRSEFSGAEFQRFDGRLRASVAALRELLARPGFGVGETTIGAELEIHLIDEAGWPAPVNTAVLEASSHERLTLELNRFNLEINAAPTLLAGQPFSALGADLDAALAEARRAASTHGTRVVAIGILPTLREEDLSAEAMTERFRYQALSAGLRRVRAQPFQVRITGDDALAIEANEVTFEGANASFQIHLRVDPARFADTYNAAQLAVAPVLAAAGNSPLFLGKRLWEETRVALFRQAVDDRGDAQDDDWRPARVSFGHGFVREGALELFAEAATLYEPLLPVMGDEDALEVVRRGGVPELAELRLQQSTVWHWNRPVYDAAGGGHLRIELRALPSGPSLVDLMANAAFHIGTILALREHMAEMLQGVTFTHARRNFYQAARNGLGAELLWPTDIGRRTAPIPAWRLVDRLLPEAERGLRAHGVDSAEASRLLGVIADRVTSGQTGARFQRAVFERARDADPWRSARAVVEAYLENQLTGRPVHTWEVE